MIHFLLADLRANAKIWGWTFVVATICGGAVSSQFALMTGGIARANETGNKDMVEATTTVAVTVIVFAAISALAVLASTTRLAIEQRRRDIGLWRALGMSPRTVRAVLLGEIGAVGALSGIVGCVLALPFARMLRPMLESENVLLPGSHPSLSGSFVFWCALIVASTSVLSGWASVRGALHAPEAGLLRGQENRPIWKKVTGQLFRGVLASGALAGLIVTLVVDPDQVEDVYSIVTGSGFAVLAFVILTTPWFSPLIERLLGVFQFGSVSWHVATRSCAMESHRSSATVLPFTIAIGLTGLFFGWEALGASGVTYEGMFSLFGPALIVAWVGGVAVIAMSAGRRRRDGALLIAAGARDGQLLTIDMAEGAIHAITAALAGLAITVGSLLAGARIFRMGIGPILAEGPWLEVGVLTAATLATTCVAVAASRALAPTGTTLAELRTAE